MQSNDTRRNGAVHVPNVQAQCSFGSAKGTERVLRQWPCMSSISGLAKVLQERQD